MTDNHPLSARARRLRQVHNAIGGVELACLAYLWFCAVTGRRDHLLRVSVGVLASEGAALVAAKGCPLGVFQRRAGDDVPMFELWFGREFAPFAIPTFSVIAVLGTVLLLIRRPKTSPESSQR